MRELSEREILGRLMILEACHQAPKKVIRKVRAKFKTMGYVSADDARILGLHVQYYTRNGDRGFNPQRGDTCFPVHYLNYAEE